MIFYQGTTNLNLFPKPKSNIVSLVPSISWYLYELIDSNSIVGISKFCEIPETVNSIPIRIGGTKIHNFNASDKSNQILSLQTEKKTPKTPLRI